MFNLNYNLDLKSTLVKHTNCLIILDICAELFENPIRGSKDIERTQKQNTVIQCLTLNYDLDLELTLVKHMYCTSTHHTWHLCRVIYESHQGFKRYRADKNTVIQCLTMFHLELWPWPWTDFSQTYALHIHSSYLIIWKSH